MSDAAIKRLKALPLLIAALSIVFTSCTSSDEKERKAAQRLLDQADSAYNAADYVLADTLVTRLNAEYPSQIEIRRQSNYLRSRLRESLTLRLMEQNDSLSVEKQLEADSLKRLFVWVSNPIEGYYVVKGQGTKIDGTTGLQARLMQDGTLYMISSLATNKVGHTSVTLSSGGESVTSKTIAHDGERNDRSSGTEIITFAGSECEPLAKFVADHQGESISLTFNGAKSHTITLSKSQADAIAAAWNFGQAMTTLRMCVARKSDLERQLALARSQAARSVPVDSIGND